MHTQPIVASPEEVLVHFLPVERRPIRPTGISLWGLRYWHEDLADLVADGSKHEIRYDPRDITYVYVRTSAGVLREAALVTPGIKRMSLWEWKRKRRLERNSENDAADAALRDAGIDKSDHVVGRSKAATRAARKQAAIEKERSGGGKPSGTAKSAHEEVHHPPEPPIDMSRPVDELPVEVWD